MKTLAQAIAETLDARNICEAKGNTNWQHNHEHKIDMFVDKLPSGSGIDSGNDLDYDKSTGKKLIINSAFHTMDDAGGYGGWVNYRVVVTTSLQHGFNLNIIGNFSSNKNAHDLKEYLYEVYNYALESAV